MDMEHKRPDEEASLLPHLLTTQTYMQTKFLNYRNLQQGRLRIDGDNAETHLAFPVYELGLRTQVRRVGPEVGVQIQP
jgi:hypothetical protein